MFYYLYQIKNIVNGKIYVGVHKTRDLEDGYMGSGRIIHSAIQKYGLVNFSKVILEFFENSEAMYAREKEVVDDEFLLREDVYNLRRGGLGGFDYINKTANSQDKSAAAKNMVQKYGNVHMKEIGLLGAQKIINEKLGFHSFEKYSYEDRVKNLSKAREMAASNEAKIKRKTTNLTRGNYQSEKNSQFGTCWIYHELIGSKKCYKSDLPLFIEQGWVKGRRIRQFANV